jgi:hypothetical protein
MKKKQSDYNPILQATYLEIVENQLRDNNPPETRKTFDRLLAAGISEHDAKLLIGSAIAAETYYIMKYKDSFNLARFIENLNKLPDQSFAER